MSWPDVGQRLHARYALDDTFYPADVVQVSDSKKHQKAPIKVSFKGWDGEDVWMAWEDLKSKLLGLTGEKSTPANVEKASRATKVEPHELPDVGSKVRAKNTDGKLATAEVVGAKLQVRYSDGTMKWVPANEVTFKPKAPPMRFECLQCGREFATEEGRDNHWWDAHIVTCKECGKVFDNETARDEHWWDTHIVYCKQCGKICASITQLVEHTREAHAVHCKQCGKICSSIRSLVQHARDVHQYSQNLIDLGK